MRFEAARRPEGEIALRTWRCRAFMRDHTFFVHGRRSICGTVRRPACPKGSDPRAANPGDEWARAVASVFNALLATDDEQLADIHARPGHPRTASMTCNSTHESNNALICQWPASAGMRSPRGRSHPHRARHIPTVEATLSRGLVPEGSRLTHDLGLPGRHLTSPKPLRN